MNGITAFVAANGSRDYGLLDFGIVPLTAAAMAKTVLLCTVLSTIAGYHLDYRGKLGVGLVRRAVEDRERRGVGCGWRITL